MSNCKHLDISDKPVLRIKPDMSVYFVNDDFSKVTGLQPEHVVLKSLSEVLPSTLPDLFEEIIRKNIRDDEPSFFIVKGKTLTGECYWALARITPYVSKLNGEKRYKIEMKMLPNNAVQEIDKMYTTIEKVYENAGKDFALKYFEGFLEDRNQTFDDYIFDTLGAGKKKIHKYFEIS